MPEQNCGLERLPECVGEYVRAVVKKMGYRRRVRDEVARELADHFADALADCTSDEERQERARRLITEFGDAKLLAVLIRRGKKRCRPAWKKAIIRSFQTCGVLLVLMILYTGWFLTGKPAPTVDYVAVLNEKSRPMVVEEDNAWGHYERAIELYVESGEDIEELVKATGRREARRRGVSGLSEAERKHLNGWLAQNSAAWDEYVKGSQKPYYWMEYEYATGSREEQWLLSIFLPQLRDLRYLSRAGIWRARIAYTEGRVQDAVADCLAVAGTARHLHQPATTLIERMIGWRIGELADGELLYMAASGVLSGVDLKDVQIELGAIYGAEWPPIDLEFERLTFADVVQHCFTQGGPGGGHLVPIKFLNLAGYERTGFGYSNLAFWTAVSMVHARRDETLAKGNALYDEWGRFFRMSPHERRICQASIDDSVLALSRHRYELLYFLIPSLDDSVLALNRHRYELLYFLMSSLRPSSISYQGKSLHEATVAVLALRRWRQEKGQYPDSLNELVAAGHIKAVPDDPYSDGALKYERRGDDFVLYSLGGDFDDDGGVETDGDPWGEKEEGGDRVFWPPDRVNGGALEAGEGK